MPCFPSRVSSAPALTGVGLKPEHYAEASALAPDSLWFEVHSENYFGLGGPHLAWLEQIRSNHRISLHGVGLSMGSGEAVDRVHLSRLDRLIKRVEPFLISEHLSWSAAAGIHVNDLLPLPYTEEALDHCIEQVRRIQEGLGRRILVENPSTYLQFAHSTIPEAEFLVALARASGCGILLDLNNLYVSSCNHEWDPDAYLAAVAADLVDEFHLAGHVINHHEQRRIHIDTHDRPICEEVWRLFSLALSRIGPRPTLIEWDASLPEFSTLLGETATAESLMGMSRATAA